ncbi:MAG: thioredoxin domain-containing protein [Candidatus Yanofskybacteria bacterium]|nr:thioredoxin domain-containing protein [Candidatus Yanofskybacteria bacterium]
MEQNAQPAQQDLTKKERKQLRRQQKEETRAQESKKRKVQRLGMWLLAALAFAGAGGGVVWLVQKSVPDLPVAGPAEILAQDQVKGSDQARVVLVEYGDFQCPACASFYPVVKTLTEEFRDEIAIVYRHFPLTSVHAKAVITARAAEAAALQGKFWEMHDLLFERQREWVQGDEQELLVQYARELELEEELFLEDLNSPAVRDKVEADRVGGLQARVNSTPTFFLNGERIQNPRSYAEFYDLIVAALEQEN